MEFQKFSFLFLRKTQPVFLGRSAAPTPPQVPRSWRRGKTARRLEKACGFFAMRLLASSQIPLPNLPLPPPILLRALRRMWGTPQGLRRWRRRTAPN